MAPSGDPLGQLTIEMSRSRHDPQTAVARRGDIVTDDGRIRVPADLDAVTAIGDEDHTGVDTAAIDRIWQAARHWYAAGMQPAIQLCLRHDGKWS